MLATGVPASGASNQTQRAERAIKPSGRSEQSNPAGGASNQTQRAERAIKPSERSEQSTPASGASNQTLNMLWQVSEAPAQKPGQPSGLGPDSNRRVAVLTHMGRPAAVAAATRLGQGLSQAGIVAALPADDIAVLDP